MDYRALLDFLEDLNNNNSKEWMDRHRKTYRQLRADFVAWLDGVDARLAALDPEYYPTPGRRGINRINNNLLYHPDRPVYKDHFGAGLDKAPGMGDFYVQVGIGDCLLAGGLWRPGPQQLGKIRQAIDYDGEVLQAILQEPAFQKNFGGLYEDEKLSRTPRGYPADHPHADLLKHKSFGAVRPLELKEVLSPDFEDLLEATYMDMLPFRRYLNRALSVEA